MLETIREFAHDELQMPGELDAACRKHKNFYPVISDWNTAVDAPIQKRS
jgi:hypothetical protein